jgi:hypothetical protein
MDNSQVEIPKSAVLMVSFRNYRFSSTNGYVIQFERGVPKMVPPHVYLEAIELGMELADEEDAPPMVPVQNGPSVAERAKEAVVAQAAALDTALKLIITRNRPTDFKNDGTPKQNKVVAEMSPEFARPTATEVSDAYQKLQENVDLAED